MSDAQNAKGAPVEPFREMTVGDLVERLREMPDHHCVTVIVDGTAGIITGVWQQSLAEGRGDAPHVLIGEREPASPIVPPEWLAPHGGESHGGDDE